MKGLGLIAGGLALTVSGNALAGTSLFEMEAIGSGGEIRSTLISTPNPLQSESNILFGEAKCGEKSKTNESKCGEKGKTKESKCGEGKCGEKGKTKESKCGEGKCGEKGKAKESKCGESKCGEKGKSTESKCGEIKM